MKRTGDYGIGSHVWPGTSKLTEECGELLQVIGKLMGTGGHERHWDGSDLRVRIQEEMGDVIASCYFVMKHCQLDPIAVARRVSEKLASYEEWREKGDPL